MRYKCLIMDHDDTVVDSTASIHYPAFKDTLKKIRPDVDISLDEFFKYNFSPGFIPFCKDILGFNEEEMAFQYINWQKNVNSKIPNVFDGMKDFLWKFYNSGGTICVSSHSDGKNILKHYKYHKLPPIERIYGWELGDDKLKPNIYTVDSIRDELGFRSSEIAMVDDLKPGRVMANNAGIDFIAVGWSHKIEEIEEYFRKNSKIYCESVSELDSYIFKD